MAPTAVNPMAIRRPGRDPAEGYQADREAAEADQADPYSADRDQPDRHVAHGNESAGTPPWRRTRQGHHPGRQLTHASADRLGGSGAAGLGDGGSRGLVAAVVAQQGDHAGEGLDQEEGTSP